MLMCPISHKHLITSGNILSMVENQLDKSIKALRTDHGHEYLSKKIKTLCDEKGIKRKFTMPSMLQQNGV